MNIDMSYVKDFMLKILSVPSPAGDTDVSINMLDEEFKKFGVTTVKTKKKALIATIEGEDNENQKMISAHIDTLGAIVREIKPNGRLKIVQIGGFAWSSVEGENVTIKTIKGKEFTGTILPDKASIHVHSDVVRETLRTDDNMEVRIDEFVKTKEDVLNIGINVGDFVYFEPRTVVTKEGFIKSRHLDDKACVAAIFGLVKYLKDNNIKPKYTTHFYINNYEELGHGIAIVPEKVKEHLALDIGTVADHQTSEETKVTICAKDSRTPYDFEFRKKLVDICEKNDIDYVVDVHYRYGSDASIAATNGFDVNFACAGPGVDATHHYERTHISSIENNVKLLVKYITE
ncbi:M42 family metallopeptidase [Clostridium aestuarii]|uniref:M42 family metallopeptidase n=1 Tax=Clostridium aestuarii TaxID=338193 RepID=A0ABT4D2C8_9CLOT|nr:M42 family metallopeptidase [Clostridium aestuarii]MCY6484792.1 M42 family metallopeptidase [Clostridium aestuarii]